LHPEHERRFVCHLLRPDGIMLTESWTGFIRPTY
jgi:hypothetical protein